MSYTAHTQRGKFMKKVLFRTLLVLIPLGLFVWWNWFTDVPLKVSPETTIITSPLTPDGKNVDYLAWLRSRLPEGLLTERNAGWRIIKEIDLRKLQRPHEGSFYISEDYWTKLCDRMKLDPAAPRLVCKSFTLGTMEEYFKGRSPEDETRFNELKGYMETDFEWSEFFEKYEDFSRAWVEENSPALDRLEEIALDPKSEFICFPFFEPFENAPLYRLEMPVHEPMYSLGTALQIRARWDLYQGNTEKAIRSVEALNRLGILMQKVSIGLVNHIVGIRLQYWGTDISFVNAKKPLTPEQWKHLAELPLYEYSSDDYLRLANDFEFPAQLDYIQFCSNRKIPKDEYFIPRHDTGFWYLGYDWNQIAREIRQDQKEAEANIRKDPWWPSHELQTTVRICPDSNWNFIRKFFFSGRKAQSQLVAEFFESMHFSDLEIQFLVSQTTHAHLFRLHCALQLYRLDHEGQLPPAFTVNAEGKPLHSWTVQLLPYLGNEAEELYTKIRLDEPWDSEWNAQFHNQMPYVFATSNEMDSQEKTSFCRVTENEKYTLAQNTEGKNWMDPAAAVTEKEAEKLKEDGNWILESDGTIDN